MGLTLYYDWKIKADLAAARRFIVKFHNAARKLAFDDISEGDCGAAENGCAAAAAKEKRSS